MSKKAWILTAVLLAGLGGARLWARKTAPESLLRYKAGDTWTLQDTVRAQIPDPETGSPLTPTTLGLFRYRVERELADGAVVVSAKLMSLKAGSSVKRLNSIPVENPERPEQLMLMSSDGSVYGPYGDVASKKAVDEAKDLDGWFASRPKTPWLWYKVPDAGLRVGGTSTREVSGETWKVHRIDDEFVGGVRCAVYEAHLEGPQAVTETTWFNHERGYPVKRQIVEQRAKNVSSTLTQVRL